MTWMNSWDIDAADMKLRQYPLLALATRVLIELRDTVNACSDGWAYWSAPAHAAGQLMSLVQKAAVSQPFAREVSAGQLKKAMVPIRKFLAKMEKKGEAGEITWPGDNGFTVAKLDAMLDPPPKQSQTPTDDDLRIQQRVLGLLLGQVVYWHPTRSRFRLRKVGENMVQGFSETDGNKLLWPAPIGYATLTHLFGTRELSLTDSREMLLENCLYALLEVFRQNVSQWDPVTARDGRTNKQLLDHAEHLLNRTGPFEEDRYGEKAAETAEA